MIEFQKWQLAMSYEQQMLCEIEYNKQQYMLFKQIHRHTSGSKPNRFAVQIAQTTIKRKR